nr:reverse transcriptase domain-containing protein [Tanacetum cinerariifolium]
PKPNIPYPSILNDQKLHERAMNQMEKFFQIFQDLHFDISFADALLLMPKFASMIQSLLANKDKLFELAKIPLNENCSVILLKKLPKKLGDPDKFLIPCDFLGMNVCHALADLGASINLMPLYIWRKLSLPELTPTRMTLELVDRSITRPKGVAEDVFVKVGKFHFPTDFVVFDFEADPRVPLILGRSFLRTGRALIDVYGEEITLSVNDEAVTFNLNQAMRYSSTYDDMSKLIADCDPDGDIFLIEKLLNDDPFQLPLMDLKKGEAAKTKSSIEEPPKLELKDLPSHLEYAYLEGIDKLPMIIAKDLKDDEKEAILKEDYKPVVQSQRRVNLKIHEVIKKEVIKLLDAGMIYPNSDSPWVSPMHCVPKKGGITIVENEKNELIPTRLVTGVAEDVFVKVGKFHFPTDFVVFDFEADPRKGEAAKAKSSIEEPPELELKDLPSHLEYAYLEVLGQRKTKHFQPIHYSRKTMTEAQIHYTTTEKEMLVVVYALEKIRPYLVLSKSIVYMDHSALKYLLSKQDAKARLLWTAYKTPIGCTPYKLVYGKSCHLPIELEHKAYWALKHVNFGLKTAGDHLKLQLNELNELCNQAYENSLIYKEKTKKLHDSKIKNHIFNVGCRVLLFNSNIKILSRKLKTRWSGTFTITQVFPYGTIELSQPDGLNFKVNGHRMKHNFGGDIPQLVVLDLQTFPIDK